MTLPLLFFFFSWGMSALLCVWVLNFLRKRKFFDVPNERSSHVMPMPRGGGIAVVATIIFFWGIILFLNIIYNGEKTILLALALMSGGIIALISWVDDLMKVPPAMRFSIHIIGVLLVMLTIPYGNHLSTPLQEWFYIPHWFERLALAILWVWFINLYNFMDGIDGLTGVETISIGLGAALILLLAGGTPEATARALVFSGAALGFMMFNWPPARMFLGDVGSVGLGFFAGILLLELIMAGQWIAALILPMYYWIDATYTVLKRIIKREAFWLPHRQHIYQQAVIRGHSHKFVSTTILANNLFLIAFAISSLYIHFYVVLPIALFTVLVTIYILLKHPVQPRGN